MLHVFAEHPRLVALVAIGYALLAGLLIRMLGRAPRDEEALPEPLRHVGAVHGPPYDWGRDEECE